MSYLFNNAVPTYTFTSNVNNVGNRFTARPMRHWRKQLQSSNVGRSKIIGMPMDRPGEIIPATNACNTCSNVQLLEEKLKKDSSCFSCNPIKNNTQLSNTSYTNNTSYLQSRCVTHAQRLAYNRAPLINYFSTAGIPIEPSDSSTGTQIRETNNCYGNNAAYKPLMTTTCNTTICNTTICNTTIYKPNNSQFSQQGGVSSGSRLARLKYNTLNNNGAAYNSASGAVGINTGQYQAQPSPSYYNKLKPQQIVVPYKIGNKTRCKPEYAEPCNINEEYLYI
jgi:hypothetical protein